MGDHFIQGLMGLIVIAIALGLLALCGYLMWRIDRDVKSIDEGQNQSRSNFR